MSYVGGERWILGTTWIDNRGKQWKFLEDGTLCYGPTKYSDAGSKYVDGLCEDYEDFDVCRLYRFSIIGNKLVYRLKKITDTTGNEFENIYYLKNTEDLNGMYVSFNPDEILDESISIAPDHNTLFFLWCYGETVYYNKRVDGRVKLWLIREEYYNEKEEKKDGV